MFFPSSTPHPSSTKLLRLLPSTTAATADLQKRLVASDPGAAALFRQQDAVNLEVEVTVPVHATAAALHKHLLVAIDCSGSMGGSTDYARLAGVSLAGVSEIFGMVDSATFLPFGSDTAVLRHDGEFPERTDASLRGLSANRGGTHFAPLLRAMRAAMDDRLADPAARCEFVVCVLSDGEPTDRDQYPQALLDFSTYSMALALGGHAVTPHMMGLRQGCSMAFLDELARALGNVDGTCQFASTGPELENMLSVAVASSVRSTFAPSFESVALLPTAPARQGVEPLRLQLPDNGLWVESNSGATSTWTGVLGEVPRAWFENGRGALRLTATIRVDPRGAPVPVQLPLPEGLTVTSVSDAAGHASNLVVGSLKDAPTPGDYLTLALAGESRVVRVVATPATGIITVTPRVPTRRWVIAAQHSGYGVNIDETLNTSEAASVSGSEVPVHRQLEVLITTLGLQVAHRVQQLLVSGAPAVELDRGLAGLDVVLREIQELNRKAQASSAEGSRTLRTASTVAERDAMRAAESRRREAVASTVAMLVACQREGVKLRGLMASNNSSVALYREASRYLFSRDLQAGAANLAKLKVGTLRRAVAKTERNSASVNAIHDEALRLSTSDDFASKLEASISSALNESHVTPFCGSLLECFRQKVTHRWPVALCAALQVSRNSAVVLDVHHLLEVVHMNGAYILYADLKDDQEHLSALATPAAAPAGGAPRDDVVARYFDVDADPYEWEIEIKTTATTTATQDHYSAPVTEMSALEAAAHEKAHGTLNNGKNGKSRANAVGVDDAGNPYNACWPIVVSPLVWRESGLFKLMNGFCSELVTGSRTSFQSSWRGVPFWLLSTAALRAAQAPDASSASGVSKGQALAVLHALETACYYAVTSDPDPLTGKTACFGFDLRGVQALVEVVEAFFADPSNRATSVQPSFLELLGMVAVYALATGKPVPWELLEVEAARRAVAGMVIDAQRAQRSDIVRVLELLIFGLAKGVTVPVGQVSASPSTFDDLAKLARHVDPSSFVKLVDPTTSTSGAGSADLALKLAIKAGGDESWLLKSELESDSDIVMVDLPAASASTAATENKPESSDAPSVVDVKVEAPREPLASAIIAVLSMPRSTTYNGNPFLALRAVRAVIYAVQDARSGKSELLRTEQDAGVVIRRSVGDVVKRELVQDLVARLAAIRSPSPMMLELTPGLLAVSLSLHNNDALLKNLDLAGASESKASEWASTRANIEIKRLTDAAQAERETNAETTAFSETGTVPETLALLVKYGLINRNHHSGFYRSALAALLVDGANIKVPLWRFKLDTLVRGKVFLREADPTAWPSAPENAHIEVASGNEVATPYPVGEAKLQSIFTELVWHLSNNPHGRRQAVNTANQLPTSFLSFKLSEGVPIKAITGKGLVVNFGNPRVTSTASKTVSVADLEKVWAPNGPLATIVQQRTDLISAIVGAGADHETPEDLDETVRLATLTLLVYEIKPALYELSMGFDSVKAAKATRVLGAVERRLAKEGNTTRDRQRKVKTVVAATDSSRK